MQTPYIASITLFAGNFAPLNWAFCDGQLLSIAQNTALFSLLGTTYGGNGQTTFGLPDLRGRAPMQPGQGPGLTNHVQGEVIGVSAVTLQVNEIPLHNHSVPNSLGAVSGVGDSANPSGRVWAASTKRDKQYATVAPDGFMASAALRMLQNGGGAPHENMQPYLVLNYIIALQGVYPSRP